MSTNIDFEKDIDVKYFKGGLIEPAGQGGYSIERSKRIPMEIFRLVYTLHVGRYW